MQGTRALLFASSVLLIAGCGNSSSGDDDDITADADPYAPDADPYAPDADPYAPDADPSAPDAFAGCDPGLEYCAGNCVDLSSSEDYCGNCNISCDPGETCVEGNCVPGVGTLVLSEIHAREPAFFELYNGDTAALELEDFLVQWNSDGGNGSGSVTLPAYTLAAGEFVVLREGAGTSGDGVIYLGDDIGWLSSIAVRLLSPVGAGIDFVRTGASTVEPPTGTAWSGANALNPSATVDQSLVRNIYTADTDTNADWSLTSLGSPGSYCPVPGRCGDTCYDFAGDHDNCGECGHECGGTQLCVNAECRSGMSKPWISEYRRWPRAGVEIHNPTVSPVELDGYRLDISGENSLSFTFPAFTLAPGAHVVVYMGVGEPDAVSLFAGYSWAFDDNVGIALYDNGTTALDFVRFGDSVEPPPSEAPWFGANVPAVSDLANFSARRDLEKLDTDGPADWSSASPATPGFTCFPGLSLCDGDCRALGVDPEHCGGCVEPCGANETCASGLCSTSGKVVISEIRRQNPQAIEVFNGTSAAVDLGGWEVSWVAGNVDSYTIEAGVTVEPGGFLYLRDDSGTSSATVIYMNANITWGEFIAVSLSNGVSEVDFVRTGSSVTDGDWTGANTPNPGANEALLRDVWTADTDTSADWTVGAGSQASACATGSAVCGGVCVDLASAPGHCGRCGNTCGVGTACHQGECVEDGALRLAPYYSNDGTYIGRIEIFHNGRWNTVNGWSNNETGPDVACRQLGFASGTYFSGASYGYCTGCGSIYSVNCAGTEARLADCPFTWTSTTYNGVRIRCETTP